MLDTRVLEDLIFINTVKLEIEVIFLCEGITRLVEVVRYSGLARRFKALGELSSMDIGVFGGSDIVIS